MLSMTSPSSSDTVGLEHDRLAALGHQLHLHVARAVQRHRLLAVIEVAVLHRRHVGARGLRPLAHAVRVLARVLLDRLGCAAVRVAFAQHRVHRAAQTLAVALPDFFFLVGLRMSWEFRKVVALGLQLLDGGQELRHRRADVRQLDDVRVRQLRQLAQFGQVVRHALLFGQVVGELGQDARRHRDVTGLDVDSGRVGKGAYHRQKGVGRKQRRLVGQRVDDGRLLGVHGCSPAVSFGQISEGLRVATVAMKVAQQLDDRDRWARPPSWLVDFMPSVLRCRIALDKRHLSPEEVFGRGKPSVPSIGAGATALTLTPAGPHSSARTVVVGSPSPFYSCTAHVTGWSRWLRVAYWPCNGFCATGAKPAAWINSRDRSWSPTICSFRG